MKRLSSKGDSQNIFVDQYKISPRPKTAEKRGFCKGITDRRTDGPTDGQTLLKRCEDASKNERKEEVKIDEERKKNNKRRL